MAQKSELEEMKNECRSLDPSLYYPLWWDISVNHRYLVYSNNKRTVQNLESGHTARGPFWKSGRHIVQIKVHQKGHVGIGIVTKAFPVGLKWVGEDKNSYGLWDRADVYIVHQEKKWGYHQPNKNNRITTRKLLIADGAVVTVDLDLNERTLNLAVNGQFVSDEDLFENIPCPAAVAASLWRKDDSVEIIDYQKM
eukprot:UN02736